MYNTCKNVWQYLSQVHVVVLHIEEEKKKVDINDMHAKQKNSSINGNSETKTTTDAESDLLLPYTLHVINTHNCIIRKYTLFQTQFVLFLFFFSLSENC